MNIQIIKTIHIEAARKVMVGADGKESYTGNRYRIDLVAEGAIDESVGWVVGYAELKGLFEPVRRFLDHHCLSDVPGLETDSSPGALEIWINEKLRPWPVWFRGVRVFPPEPTGFILKYLPAEPESNLPERHMFLFAAAQSLPHLPEGHPCRFVHGHTYQLEFACRDTVAAPVLAESLYNQLNGRYLNSIGGLEQSTAERIALWVWRHFERSAAGPVLVGVQETPDNKCYYFGD